MSATRGSKSMAVDALEDSARMEPFESKKAARKTGAAFFDDSFGSGSSGRDS